MIGNLWGRRSRASLRRALVLSGAFAVTVSATVLLVFVSLTVAQRSDVQRDDDAFMSEQSIADEIVTLTYEQQLAAYRFLHEPQPRHRDAFHAHGEAAYRAMRGYLTHDMSTAARLQVEHIKEVHQQFEVSAERAFDLVVRGQPTAAMERLARTDERAASLDEAVIQFLAERKAGRDALRLQYQTRTVTMQRVLVVGGISLALLAVVGAELLRRRVLRPLSDLAVAAHRLGDGDTGVRVPGQRYEEFDAVASVFNTMADRVESARDDVVAHNRELRDALEHLRTTQEELVQHEKLSAMGQMLAGLAHELNNPLTGILGLSELLHAELAVAADPVSRRLGRELAEPLEREALRARTLVRNLLSFARKPSGTLQPVGLAAAVSIAVGLRAYSFAASGKTLHVAVDPSLHVRADAQKLEHSIVNVVNNALDALTGSAGTGLTITGHAESETVVRLDFDDDGPGFVDPEAAFEPFHTTKSADAGTGLGLALVRQFLTEAGGSVTAETLPAGGARITFRLVRETECANAAPPSARSAVAVAVAPRAALDTELTVPAESPPLVLVVDDEPTIREIQRRVLERAGIRVLVAPSGTAARDILLNQSVDLVVTDLRMPGKMDGRDLLEWLERERPVLGEHALLVTGDVSGDASLPFPVTSHRLIKKPFTNEGYLARVQAALASSLRDRVAS